MNFLTQVFDHLEDALVITDNKGSIVLFNKQAFLFSQHLLGPIKEGEQIDFFLRNPRNDLVREIYWNINEKKRPERSFAEYSLEGNATSYFEFSFNPILENSGMVSQVLVFIRDVTQQKVFEKKLVNTNENTQHLVEIANAMSLL
ncbi:MAG: PAS domain S-box protein [Cyclobacteriaceae bacterium]|nr:PAS domain S-box protein [Cyclobacteriaceae bacterium]